MLRSTSPIRVRPQNAALQAAESELIEPEPTDMAATEPTESAESAAAIEPDAPGGATAVDGEPAEAAAKPTGEPADNADSA